MNSFQARSMAMTISLAGILALPLASEAKPGGTPAPPLAWAQDFKVFNTSPKSISYLVSQREYETGSFLMLGSRPKEDKPTRPLFGKPPRPGEWMMEDSTGAIRVAGIPAPEPGQIVVLAARFASSDAEPALQGIRVVAAGRRDGTDVIRVGEFIHFPMSSTKSASSYPEFFGDTASVESLSFLDGVILRGIKPGTVTIKVFEQWWNRPVPELVEVFELKIAAP